jgi:hypothetical protein
MLLNCHFAPFIPPLGHPWTSVLTIVPPRLDRALSTAESVKGLAVTRSDEGIKGDGENGRKKIERDGVEILRARECLAYPHNSAGFQREYARTAETFD